MMVVVMVVVLRVVGLVVHVGSGVVHMLAEPTVFVLVLSAHMVVVWGQVASLWAGPSFHVLCRHVLWAQPSFHVGQEVDQPTGRRALEGSQPVVVVVGIAWKRLVEANHILRLWVVVVVEHELRQARVVLLGRAPEWPF